MHRWPGSSKLPLHMQACSADHTPSTCGAAALRCCVGVGCDALTLSWLMLRSVACAEQTAVIAAAVGPAGWWWYSSHGCVVLVTTRPSHTFTESQRAPLTKPPALHHGPPHRVRHRLGLSISRCPVCGVSFSCVAGWMPWHRPCADLHRRCEGQHPGRPDLVDRHPVSIYIYLYTCIYTSARHPPVAANFGRHHPGRSRITTHATPQHMPHTQTHTPERRRKPRCAPPHT